MKVYNNFNEMFFANAIPNLAETKRLWEEKQKAEAEKRRQQEELEKQKQENELYRITPLAFVTGKPHDTYRYKESIKRFGGRWDAPNKRWVFYSTEKADNFRDWTERRGLCERLKVEEL